MLLGAAIAAVGMLAAREYAALVFTGLTLAVAALGGVVAAALVTIYTAPFLDANGALAYPRPQLELARTASAFFVAFSAVLGAAHMSPLWLGLAAGAAGATALWVCVYVRATLGRATV